MEIKTIVGDLGGRGLRIAILSARFNEFIVDKLVEGAIDCLKRHGVNSDDLTLVRVPGAFELPLAVERLAASRRFDGIVALGCVIRGATAHFDFVAGEASRGLAAASREHGMPIGFGLLTVDTIEQALERAGTKAGNKGADAALTVLEMANLLRQLER